jgi:hypothetical protein
VLIRSIFSGPGVSVLPDTVPGYASASVTQRLDEFVRDYAGKKYGSYQALLANQH